MQRMTADFCLKRIREGFGMTLGMALVTACSLMVLGCKSTGKPASSHFASVELQGNTPGQIRDVAVDVFKEHQYVVSKSRTDAMVFEREGTEWDNIAYGNWMGGAVWVRVKASIVPVSEGTFRLQCNAFMVRDRGGSTEEEVKLTSLKSHSYQKLLDEVSQRLHGPLMVPK
jgi:hypothetical protein